MKHIFLLVLIILICAPLSVHADVVSWKDAKTGVSITYPDTWHIQSNRYPADIITLNVPNDSHSSCLIRSYDDKRFAIYPPKLDWAVQKHAYNQHFWGQYLLAQGYHNITLQHVVDGAGLGRGYAGFAIADFSAVIPEQDIMHRGLMFVSNYNNRLYVYECSTSVGRFETLKNMFLSVAKTIDFDKATHELTTGDYYNFLRHKTILFEGNEGPNRLKY